ncbi:hypothetical protein [Tateyamaria sp. ANG-S1]|uniref:hypothetical protein n=1 Tax=Tateyamaria sp. ANG-S1 TaxID=1577905 RepID=UPI00057DF41E|nr:hypothetical protein [Tateyamaria sp. ANG-S1]KIC48766.1 hypothetical protein RA29_13830 [Tateyamaria sp. ANG-S1]
MTDLTEQRKPIKRHTVSDLDGTQQGGLAFVIAVIGGMIAAASLAPGALTSFWVWCVLLMMSIAIGMGVQHVFARETVEDVE